MFNFNEDTAYAIFLNVIKLHYKKTYSALENLGIYPGQPHLLGILHHKDGQSQKDLAKKLNIKPSTITVTIKTLEKNGLIERIQDQVDQRITRIFITEEGKKIYESIHETMKKVEEECFKNFTEEEKMLFRRLLIQMRDNLKNDICN